MPWTRDLSLPLFLVMSLTLAGCGDSVWKLSYDNRLDEPVQVQMLDRGDKVIYSFEVPTRTVETGSVMDISLPQKVRVVTVNSGRTVLEHTLTEADLKAGRNTIVVQ